MRRNIALSFLVGIFLSAISFFPALAAEAVPGDACSTANYTSYSGGPETSGKAYIMTCQGGVWVRIIESDTAGNLGVKQAAPKAPLDVGGEIKIGVTTGLACDADREGTIRYNTTSNILEFCDGSTWRSISATAPTADCIPDAFSFTDVIDQSLSALIASNTLTITGIDSGCVVSVSGSGTPEISVNSSTWVGAATINSGDTLKTRQISSSSVSTARTATVTIGSTSDNWSVTTRAGQLRVFMTSGSYSGNLGGLVGADSICQAEAGSLGYSGTWKAILSDSTTDANSRVTLVYPIVRASSTSTVVESANLWASALEAVVTTTGAYIWSGSNAAGGKYGSNYCSDWTSASSGVNGRIGLGNQTSGNWIALSSPFTQSCDTSRPLQCIEQ